MMHSAQPIHFIQPSNTSRTKFSAKVPDYIIGWILQNTTPSSNMRNTVRVVVPQRPTFIPVKKLRGGRLFVEHVVRWRTDSLLDMYRACKQEVPDEFNDMERNFSFNYFYDCIPDFVKMRKKMDGLCPIHHSGMSWENEIARHRLKWHKNCACKTCVFCKPAPHGCDHGRNPLGGSCTRFTCLRCRNKRCFIDWADNMHTQWIVKVQRTRDTGGTTWVDEVENGTRSDFMQLARDEMETFDKHHEHCQWHKRKVTELLANLRPGEVYIKFDYIQNIVHERGAETSSAYYGKRQTQFLSFVVWYCKRDHNGNVTRHKIYRDYLSSYLKHNSLYWQKSIKHLLRHLRNKLKIKIKKVCYTSAAVLILSQLWFDSDGGRAHFKSRISFWFVSKLAVRLGMCMYQLWFLVYSRHSNTLDFLPLLSWKRRLRWAWSYCEKENTALGSKSYANTVAVYCLLYQSKAPCG